MPSQQIEKRLRRHITGNLQFMRSSAFYQAVLRHELKRESYIAYLRSLTMIYAFLESPVELGLKKVLQKFGLDMNPKLHRIRADLDSLNAGIGPDLVEPAQLCYELIRQMRLKSLSTPVKSLGYLVALEAFMLEMQEAVPDLQSAFPSALTHLETPQSKLQELIKPFIIPLGQVKSELWESFLEAAKEMLSGFKAILDACYPADHKKRQFLATTLNPEAGLHLITQREDELHIGIGIGNKLLEQMPYMYQRYGDRARAFVYSDLAWQIQLTHLPYETMQEQIQWLAKLLAVKGMPTYTFIVKLYELEAELTSHNPKEAPRYQKLKAVGHFFEEQNRQRLKPDTQKVIARRVFQNLAPELGESFEHILTSAVTDELNGYRGAEESVKTWIEQNTNLSSRFIQSCIRMLDELKPCCN